MSEKSAAEVYNEDVAQILRALGLSDHARPVSAHEVVQTEILPAIAEHFRQVERLANLVDTVATTLDTRKLDGAIGLLRAMVPPASDSRTP